MRRNKNSKICFVISPIGDIDSGIRQHADKVFKHIITPALKKTGYKPVRADQLSEPGNIPQQVVRYLMEAPLALAILTGQNPNVMYELAHRHFINKPVIHILEKGEKLPFDFAATRTIWYNIQDLDSVEKAKRDIESQLKTIESGEPGADTPIHQYFHSQLLKGHKAYDQQFLVTLLSSIKQTRT